METNSSYILHKVYNEYETLESNSYNYLGKCWEKFNKRADGVSFSQSYKE